MRRKIDVESIAQKTFDLLIVGGGITGAGILEEAGRRGYTALLIDKGDFSSGTSSRSAKLVHGGIRYLQHGRFVLVREGLRERNFLLKKFPHLVKPMPFIFPIYGSPWRIHLGMKIYDWLSRGSGLPKYRFLSPKQTQEKFSHINSENLTGSFLYYDAFTNDSRLCNEVIHQAVQDYEVEALNYFELKGVKNNSEFPEINCYDHINSRECTISAHCVVNATGPWADKTLQLLNMKEEEHLAASKGVHIVLSGKRFSSSPAIAFTSARHDVHMFYAVPWENNSVVIGVTDTEFSDRPDSVRVSDDDVQHLLKAVNVVAPSLKVSTEDILSSYVGIRPLLKSDETSKKRSRDYKIWWSDKFMINVLGGKLTSFHSMAENLVNEVEKKLTPEIRNPKQNLEAEDVSYSNSRFFEQYGRQTENLHLILEENPSHKNELHPDLEITVGELIYFIRNQSCCHLTDLLNRRLSLGYVIRGYDKALEIVSQVARIMKDELNWSDEEYDRELSEYRKTYMESKN